MSNPASPDDPLDCLVREFYAYIHRLARSILDDGRPGAAAEAEDAVQDVFLLAARALPNFRGEASLKTWLTTITLNHCRGRLRKRRSRLQLAERFRRHETEVDPPAGPETSLVADDEKRALWAAVDALPEKQRIPLVLFYVHELSAAEIAQSLALPEGTIHSRLHHARRKIQARLEKSDD